MGTIERMIGEEFSKHNPIKKERKAAVNKLWERMKNKNDVEDILIDAKVDEKRIYQPAAPAKRVKMKTTKDN